MSMGKHRTLAGTQKLMRKLDSVAHLSVVEMDSLILNCIFFFSRSDLHKMILILF